MPSPVATNSSEELTPTAALASTRPASSPAAPLLLRLDVDPARHTAPVKLSDSMTPPTSPNDDEPPLDGLSASTSCSAASCSSSSTLSSACRSDEPKNVEATNKPSPQAHEKQLETEHSTAESGTWRR